MFSPLSNPGPEPWAGGALCEHPTGSTSLFPLVQGPPSPVAAKGMLWDPEQDGGNQVKLCSDSEPARGERAPKLGCNNRAERKGPNYPASLGFGVHLCQQGPGDPNTVPFCSPSGSQTFQGCRGQGASGITSSLPPLQSSETAGVIPTTAPVATVPPSTAGPAPAGSRGAPAVTLGTRMPGHEEGWKVEAVFHSQAPITASVLFNLSFPSCCRTRVLCLLPCLSLSAPPRRYQRA